MLKSFLVMTLLVGTATTAAAREITVLDWNGANGKSHLEGNLSNVLASSYEFWANTDVELKHRFTPWLAH